MNAKADTRPAFELRVGGMHLTVQRVPGWLVALFTTASGAAGTWWGQR
ncbi:hypothetical protein ACIGW0_14500 [Streptomyces bikiniensis]|uniref:Uncharacterized protein n=1 Tax=Streptomyces bikiniensis TaxID=1896 RepID=A0ABW8CVR5_STRBI